MQDQCVNMIKKKKNKEFFVVSPSDTVTQPFTMMIKTMDTVPVEMAMESSLRSEDQACIAIFKSCDNASIVA